MSGPFRAAETAARESYGRLLSNLAYRWRDIAAAEDALSDAFAKALETWPRDGVPDNPDAWLTTVAKRELLHAARHRRLTVDPTVTAVLEQSEFADNALERDLVNSDDRLKLMFVCAHPAIDAEIHTALMLQTVMSLDAERIASAFLVKPATLAQRLVRAKAKIRSTQIRFELPAAGEFESRSPSVLEAVYAAHTLGWHNAANDDVVADVHDAQQSQRDLAEEALFLSRLCASQMPDNAEALGLFALLQFCEARRPASVADDGGFIPLQAQLPSRWNTALIANAEAALEQALSLGEMGPYQLQAAIQSAHCQRLYGGATPWSAVATLYEQLLALAPSTGARVGHAVAISESGRAAEALHLLDAFDRSQVETYQPYWVAKAHVLTSLGRTADATAAYSQAIGLTEHSVIRDYLFGKVAALRVSGA